MCIRDRSRTDRDELDIDAAGVHALKPAPDLGHVHAGWIGAQEDEMGIAHVDGTGPAISKLLRLVGTQFGFAHIDRGRRSPDCVSGPVLDGPDAVSYTH